MDDEFIVNKESANIGNKGLENPQDEAKALEIKELISELQSSSDLKPELIGLTAEIAAPLYGILNFAELADVVNHYNPGANVLKDDIMPALISHIELSGEEVDYTIFEGFVVSPLILPNAFEVNDADVELINHIRKEQKNHPRFLPTYEEFALYATPMHEMMGEEFNRFALFLEKNKKRIGLGDNELGNAASTFLQLLKAGMEPRYFVEFFKEEGCTFNSKQFIDEMMVLATDLYKNTRMYDLNGNTMNELGVATVPEPRTVTKTGRNDPCTCGSGKKFKKCCL